MAIPPVDEGATAAWTASRYFDLLARLGRLRVISVCGPSVFESLCEVGSVDLAGSYLNAITDDYHWHLDLHRFRHLRSHDSVHRRSGRRVLFFELRESAESSPFLRIYLHRAKEEDFAPAREALFAAAHAELSAGHSLQQETSQ